MQKVVIVWIRGLILIAIRNITAGAGICFEVTCNENAQCEGGPGLPPGYPEPDGDHPWGPWLIGLEQSEVVNNTICLQRDDVIYIPFNPLL